MEIGWIVPMMNIGGFSGLKRKLISLLSGYPFKEFLFETEGNYLNHLFLSYLL